MEVSYPSMTSPLQVYSGERSDHDGEDPGEEAPVEVDQRALIDKVLARYSGEFTLFRELLQNADDAESLAVEIHFETAVCQHHAEEEDIHPLISSGLTDVEVVQWTFKNDGNPFNEEDWKRLPRIAAGNPSPEKIGAFGVGFYSLFSVTENPCVSSGGREMQFYWKDNDNQLYVRRRTLLKDGVANRWTTFKMPLRVPGPMPPLLDLMRFLASSITFMVNLSSVGVFLDGHRVGHIYKSLKSSRTIDVPEGMKRSSPGNSMHVKDVRCHNVAIESEIVNGVYGEMIPSLAKTVKARVDLTVFTAEVAVMMDPRISTELHRCMKKRLPSHLKYSLIFTGRDEYDCSEWRDHGSDDEASDIFRGLRADLEAAKHSRIFIGHATGQTTGIGGHMASCFIPTVEREAIDFVDNYVSMWNKELLYVGGFLSRTVYELELSDIQNLWDGVTDDAGRRALLDPRDHLHLRFLHVLRFFSFHRSTPSQSVAKILRESFYECSSLPLRLLSSVGVRPASDVKVFDPKVAEFLDSLPMLSELVGREAARTIMAFPDPWKVLPITVKDVLLALAGQTLNEEKLIFCLQWWLKSMHPGLKATELLNAITFSDSRRIPYSLSLSEYFISTKGLSVHIPHDGPLPESLIPISISERFTPAELASFGWREFTVIDWFRYISRRDVMSENPTYDFTKSTDWAERVMWVLSRAWPSLADQIRHEVKMVFECNECIPTSRGLRRPNCSYFPSVNDALFCKLGLPLVTFASAIRLDGELMVLLSFIGVPPHIPLELLLDKMVKTGEWSISAFITYLVRLSPPLTPQQVSMLKEQKIFSKEHPQNDGGNELRYYAHELYPPVESFRQLQLPIVDWDKESRWLSESNEAKLLYRLGLCPHPPLEEIIGLCTSNNTLLRSTAFRYLCENLLSKYSKYDPEDFQSVGFVPAENEWETCLKSPKEVFLDTRWKALGFYVVQTDFQSVITHELGIRQHPTPKLILDSLERTHPPNEDTACQWFEYMSEHLQSFSRHELTRLSELRIVPTSSSGAQEWLTPAQCYLGPPMDEFHSKMFVFVDFGARANHFLKSCGTMKEPSVRDVVEILIRDPDRFFEVAERHGGFLEKLRELVIQRTHIPNDMLHRLSSRRTLLGLRREGVKEHVKWKSINALRTPREIVIVDDPRDYTLFSDAVFVAPQDELLERFYSSVGSRKLSTVIQERYEMSQRIPDTAACSEVKALILERLPLFLNRCSHSDCDKTRIPSNDNFSVMVCERLLVHKTLIIGDNNTPRKQDLWATVKYIEDEGRIELWLSRNAKRDMYDLAASLCRLLFRAIRVNDILLLATMLSDLQLMRRAGFDVDQSSGKLPNEPSTEESTHSLPSNTMTQSYLPESVFRYIRHSISDTLGGARTVYRMVTGGLISSPGASFAYENTMAIPPRILHQNYIRDAVEKAAEACKSGGGLLLDDNNGIHFLENHSCNNFEQIEGFRSLGIWEGIEFHVAEDLSEIDAFMGHKQEPLARFISVLTPVASAHNVSMKSLHIFFDAVEGPIACNLEGSIYLNLRYYQEWHDEDVRNGRLQQAQLSWFFVLAHEVAHNLVSSHGPAHEFWFSAICEARISDFFTTI